jgi:hypothetical protein
MRHTEGNNPARSPGITPDGRRRPMRDAIASGHERL